MADSANETLAPVEPVAVLPSTELSEKATSSSSSKPAAAAAAITPAKSTPPPKKHQQASALVRADSFIAHLQRCMQTRAGADSVLMFACYSTRLAGNLLELGGRAALRSSARQLVSALFALPPSTSVVIEAGATMPPVVAAALGLAARLQAYSGMVSEMRTMGRLWGLLGLYSAVKGLVAKTFAARKEAKEKGGGGADSLSDESAEQTFAALVAWAQVLSLVVFQACENLAYLGSKKILPIKPLNQGRLAILSVRFWAAYVAMEAVKHVVERARRLSPTGGVVKTQEQRAWQEGWRKAFYRNMAWAPLTAHWGTPGGLMPDVFVALFAMYPATGGLRDLWRATA
ncbi:hypothetical protein PWT90_10339 [Aphanocladium album]|nr:hypothetical protein PWT90_10339 [Aphanocladium album]